MNPLPLNPLPSLQETWTGLDGSRDHQLAKELLEKATCAFNFWGERMVTVEGYEGTLPLERIADRLSSYSHDFLEAVKRGTASEPAPAWPKTAERKNGVLLCGRCAALYKEADQELRSWTFTALIKRIAVFIFSSLPISLPSSASLFVEESQVGKNRFCTYDKREFIEKFTPKEDCSLEGSLVVQEAKEVLDFFDPFEELFEGSSYLFNELPTSSLDWLREEGLDPLPSLEGRDPVTKGRPGDIPLSTLNGKPTTPIVVQLYTIDETNQQIDKCLLLMPYREEASKEGKKPSLCWMQQKPKDLTEPAFLKLHFAISPTKTITLVQFDVIGGVHQTKEPLEQVKQLLSTGTSKDLYGRTWSLAHSRA